MSKPKTGYPRYLPGRRKRQKRNPPNGGGGKPAYATTYYGKTTSKSYYPDNLPLTVGTGPMAKDSYSHGAIIHGNMKDPNAWNYLRDEIDYFRGQIVAYYPGTNVASIKTGYIGGNAANQTPGFPAWDRTLVYNKALENLNEKVRGSLDLGVSIAEAKQVIGMFRGLRTLEALGRNLSTRSAANAWLEFQYGWKPLMSDLYGGIEEGLRYVLNKVERYSARASLPISVSTQVARQVSGIPVSNVLMRGSGKQSCTIKIEVEVVDGFDASRWSSLNPVSLAWELTPYSFVADWFVDVGSYIRNLETALLYRCRFRKGYVSELYYYDGTEYAPNTWWPPSTSRWFGGYGGRRRSEFYRTVLTSYPFPRIPTVNVALGWQRLTSLAALIRQKIR